MVPSERLTYGSGRLSFFGFGPYEERRAVLAHIPRPEAPEPFYYCRPETGIGRDRDRL